MERPKNISRRFFLKKASGLAAAYLIPKSLGNFFEKNIEIPPIESVQNILQNTKPEIKKHISKTVHDGETVYHLTLKNWIYISKYSPETRKQILDNFYNNLKPVIERHIKTSTIKIPVDIYLMILAKESLFLTSYPAQAGNNPLHMNDTGNKIGVIGDHETFTWTDVRTPYNMIQFEGIHDVLESFDKLFKYWATKLKYIQTDSKQLTKKSLQKVPKLTTEQCIEIFTNKTCWNSGSGNTTAHFNEWLQRVQKRF